jgi:transcriptional regulator GlxA family with amidase domain
VDPRVEIALVLIQERYSQKLTLQEISQEVHLTREHFCRLFKSEMGIPPARFLKAMRLRKGKELLENTLMSVKEITYKVGVNDESHFVRDIKLAYGLTPTQLRSRKSHADPTLSKSHINFR